MKTALLALPLVLLSLLAAIWGGWIRTGWNLPLTAAAAQHGNLMVNSFLASLIMLERAILFRQLWVRLLPLLNAASVLAFLAGAPMLAEAFLIAGGTGFLLLCCWFVARYRELYYYVFAAGAFCGLAGHLVFLRTGSYAAAAPCWIDFLLLTIVAERLELSKFLPRTGVQKGLLLLFLAAALGALLPADPVAGRALLALALGATGLWLLRYDMARRALRANGTHYYSALLLIIGFWWLLACAAFLLGQGRVVFGYDAVLHSFFIGFVFSMIFAHAPVILPALLKKRLQLYHPVLYVPFVLLQLSLLLRLCADLHGSGALRRWAGLGNGISILLFAGMVALRTTRQLRSGKA
ncbi:hypothetical protein [Flaviaesturariibacter terrae]